MSFKYLKLMKNEFHLKRSLRLIENLLSGASEMFCCDFEASAFEFNK